MKQYLMYLRKSRMDTDYEEVSVAETLSRHRTTLEKLCRSKKLHVAEVLEEVVSGESLSARKGQWRQNSVVNNLNNEVYLGKIRWRHEPVKRVVKDGMLAKKCILNDDYEIYDGRHEPIITQEQWDRVKAVQAKKNHAPVNTERQLQNPFAGILVCGKCGAIMKRNIPDKKRNPTPWYRCSRRGCDCKIIKCSTVETAIYDAMEEWLDNYTLQLKSNQPQKTDPIEAELESVRGQLVSLQAQQDTICEYLEKGVYTIDMFTKRNSTLSNDIRKLQTTEASLLRQKSDGSRKEQMKDQIIPVTQQILDSYPILTPLEKNQLWKLLMKKATVYRSQDDSLRVHIYPNLPK